MNFKNLLIIIQKKFTVINRCK